MSDFDQERSRRSYRYSKEEVLFSFGRKSDALDGDGESILSPGKRRSCSSDFNDEGSSLSSRTFRSARGMVKENCPEHEIHHVSRASSFSAHRPSVSVSVPVQVSHIGNMSFSSYDVEAARTHADEAELQDFVTTNTHKKEKPYPVLLKFSDVKYRVTLSLSKSWKDMCSRNKEAMREKEILHKINGSVGPGDLLAMMGPSGSGKTTLLSLLGGRNQQNMTGEITYNGIPFNKTLKRRLGFVTQDDILYPHLTVRETLVYAALLLLPRELGKETKVERADQVINDLRLERCKDTRIGGAFLRGVSGGERKRVCIAQELLMDPSMLLLDEPTSGLDSTTATRLIQLLKSISLEGRTVITTIHQPSSKVFHSFSKLLLLSEGSLIYFGKTSSALEYFSSLGFGPQIPMNPADFLLDLCSGNIEEISLPPVFQKYPAKTKDIREHMINAYESLRRSQTEEIKEESEIQEIIEPQNAESRGRGASWWVQFSVLMIRSLKESRHEYLSRLRFAQIISIAVMSGFIWWQTNIDTETSLEDQVGLLFFIAMLWGYLPLYTTIFTFPSERAIVAKERLSNMYCLSAYFVARTVGDLPLDLIMTTIFTTIVYLMAGLPLAGGPFLLTILTIFLSVITSQGLGQAIGAILLDVKKATTVASVVVLAFLICGGYFVQSIPEFIRWLKYLSFQYHTFRLLVKVQYSANQLYDCTTSSGCKTLGSSPVFHGMNLRRGSTDVWEMLVMVVSYRFIAYIALRKMKLSF